MKKKQTYIIGDFNPPKKKVTTQITISTDKPNKPNKPKQKKKPVKNKRPQNFETKSATPINNAFAEAFAKAGLTADNFKKKS
tara:strand:- start:4223 stop:4468 length:246 start_codon:yes stop_codon:yes gene_type:complete